MNTQITVSVIINQSIDKVWDAFTNPNRVTQWNFAIDDWHCPQAENNLVEGGKFNYRMEAKDGSMGFDFTGTFDKIKPTSQLDITLDDGRLMKVTFEEKEHSTIVTETFDAEDQNPIEMQEQGWQLILNNFKKYSEL